MVLVHVLSLSAGWAQCGEKNQNHLDNYSFSKGISGWMTDGEEFSVEVLDEGTEDENGYLVISGPSSRLLQRVRVPTNARSVCVGAMIKNTVSSPSTGWALLEISILDPRGKTIKKERLPLLKPGTHWQKLRKSLALPAQAASVAIRLEAKARPELQMDNEARFDDVFVRFGK